MWIYSQSTGELSHNDIVVAKGYAGRGDGLNNPAMQDVSKIGPCPQGIYSIGTAHTDAKVGLIAMRLTPSSTNQMFGRADFFIHGPHPNDQHDSSEGCLIFGHDVRTGIAAAVAQGDNTLHVTE